MGISTKISIIMARYILFVTTERALLKYIGSHNVI